MDDQAWRHADDDRNATVTWRPATGADGYLVRFGDAQGRLYHSLGRADEGVHRAVRIGARVHIQEFDIGYGADGFRYRFDFFLVTAFGKIGDTFDNGVFRHGELHPSWYVHREKPMELDSHYGRFFPIWLYGKSWHPGAGRACPGIASRTGPSPKRDRAYQSGFLSSLP